MKTIKVSELISKLEEIKKVKGDLDVICTNYPGDRDFVSIDEVGVSLIHPNNIADSFEEDVEYDGTEEEFINCIVLS